MPAIPASTPRVWSFEATINDDNELGATVVYQAQTMQGNVYFPGAPMLYVDGSNDIADLITDDQAAAIESVSDTMAPTHYVFP